MTYFLNVFPSEFKGVWVLGDRQYSPEFRCPGNFGRDDELIKAWNLPPYDLSGVDADGNDTSDLTISFAFDPDLTLYNDIVVDITSMAVSAAAVTVDEIVAALNANSTFASYFLAFAHWPQSPASDARELRIRSKRPGVNMRYYVNRFGAETVLQFNARAGVAELPTYFDRHTIDNQDAFADSVGNLIALDPAAAGGASVVDDDVINDAVNAKGVSLGLDASVVQDDYLLLRGRSGLFLFENNTVDGSNRITETIQYHAGAQVGDLAMRIAYTYTGANTMPDQVTREPYTLTSGDIITPP